MKTRCIGIDIDSVLADSIKMFIPYFNERFKKNLSIDDIIHYQFEKCYGVSESEVMEAFKDLTRSNEWSKIPRMEFSGEFLNALIDELNYTVVIVTSRPEKYMGVLTVDWLKSQNFRYDDLLFMSENDCDKYQTGLKNNYKFDIFIEDCLEFAEKILAYNIPVLLYDYPWNRNGAHPGIIRIKDLREALTIIKHIELKK